MTVTHFWSQHQVVTGGTAILHLLHFSVPDVAAWFSTRLNMNIAFIFVYRIRNERQKQNKTKNQHTDLQLAKAANYLLFSFVIMSFTLKTTTVCTFCKACMTKYSILTPSKYRNLPVHLPSKFLILMLTSNQTSTTESICSKYHWLIFLFGHLLLGDTGSSWNLLSFPDWAVTMRWPSSPSPNWHKSQSEPSDCVVPPTIQQAVCAQQEETSAAFHRHKMFFLCSQPMPVPQNSILPSDLLQ